MPRPAFRRVRSGRHGAVASPVAAGLVAALLTAAACGSTSSAEQALSATTEKLAEIRSGHLTFRLLSAASGDDARVGFELRGPFALPERGALPEARLAFMRIAGKEREAVTFVSTGTRAFVEVGGEAFELPPERVRSLRGPEGAPSGDGGVLALEVGDWVRDPRLSSGPTVDGEPTDRVAGGLDVVAALNDLLEMARRLGSPMGALPPVEGEEADRLRAAVRRATVEVLTGREDRFLRRLLMKVDFGVAPSAAAARAITDMVGASVVLELSLRRPNAPVSVAEPASPRPFSDLTREARR